MGTFLTAGWAFPSKANATNKIDNNVALLSMRISFRIVHHERERTVGAVLRHAQDVHFGFLAGTDYTPNHSEVGLLAVKLPYNARC
jgi:hypothetical protein